MTRIAGVARIGGLAVGALGLGMTPMPFLLVGGWTAAGVAIGLSYAVQFTPAAITAVRSAELDGIAASTWTMALVEAVVWLAYGLSVSDTALVLGGSGGTVMSVVILAAVWRYERARAPQRLLRRGLDPGQLAALAAVEK